MGYNYMLKYKGTYRLKAEIDRETYDYPRTVSGLIDESFDDVYIECCHGNRIYYYGRQPDVPGVLLWAYVPSIIRGRHIKKQLASVGVSIFLYREAETEVSFLFHPVDLDIVAPLLRAKTFGANISPFSVKNLPKPDVEIPLEQMQKYKQIISVIQKNDYLIIKSITDDFVKRFLTKAMKRERKNYNFFQDIRANKMSRSVKTYIWKMGFWDEYLAYLQKKIKTYYKNKNKQEVANE